MFILSGFRLWLPAAPALGGRFMRDGCVDSRVVEIAYDECGSLNAYLNHLQTEQNCTRATRNNQLAALRAFISYASACSPEYVATSLDVARIKTQKDDLFSKVEYLTENAASAILAAPDMSTAKVRKDQPCSPSCMTPAPTWSIVDHILLRLELDHISL